MNIIKQRRAVSVATTQPFCPSYVLAGSTVPLAALTHALSQLPCYWLPNRGILITA